jgi:hypothetical protein
MDEYREKMRDRHYYLQFLLVDGVAQGCFAREPACPEWGIPKGRTEAGLKNVTCPGPIPGYLSVFMLQRCF